MKIGFHLSSEEHPPNRLVEMGRLAEQAGFASCSISDHFHPWSENQGHSPFVWSTLGGLATATGMSFTTLVTCPSMRIHPGLVAHAAATTATMLDGRFTLGVGTGERLNEHVLGDHWPPHSVRLRRMREAIEVIRSLWEGELTSFDGEYFTVENAKIYDLPHDPIPLFVAASGADAGEAAAELGDGLVALSPDDEGVDAFKSAGAGKPIVGMTHVCCAETRDKALETVRHWWPTTGLAGPLKSELAIPDHFDAAAGSGPDDETIAGEIVLGDDVDAHLTELQRYADAGFDTVWIHQVGPDQERFADVYAQSVLPAFNGGANGG